MAALQASQSRRPTPGHYLMDHLHDLTEALNRRHRQLQLTFRWVPGHEGVVGNERADQEAKQAARGLSSPTADLPKCLRDTLPASVSKVKQNLTAKLKNNALSSWQRSPRYAKLHRIDPSMPSKHFEDLTTSLPRRHASILIQLRSGHAPLHQYLHRIQRAPSSVCPSCRAAKETVRHFLLDCPTYRRQRETLIRSLGRSARSIRMLLSKGCAVKPLFRYIHATGRFTDSYGNLEIPDEIERPQNTSPLLRQ